MSIDADGGSLEASSALGAIKEESRYQSSVAKDDNAHHPHHAVHEPPGSPLIQPVVPATAERDSAAHVETSPSSHPNDAPTEPPAPAVATNLPSNPFGHSLLGLKTKYSLPKPQAPPRPGYIDPRDYEKKYPEDTIYEEQSENARLASLLG
ncbi:hypothetical protein EYR36_002930 [Pleurotus pulmonarius]|nr:hypothetical protein EYR36_002930 [Pleurotus pulmonarius]